MWPLVGFLLAFAIKTGGHLTSLQPSQQEITATTSTISTNPVRSSSYNRAAVRDPKPFCPDSCRCTWETGEYLAELSCEFAPAEKSTCSDTDWIEKRILLRVLAFDGCLGLEHLAADTFPENLVELRLKNGALEVVEVLSAGEELEVLDLSYNRISHIPEGFWQPLANLKSLDLSGNRLVEFDFPASRHLTSFLTDDSKLLERLNFAAAQGGRRLGLRSFSASNCPKLSKVCPWIFWASPGLERADYFLQNQGRIWAKAKRFAKGFENPVECGCYGEPCAGRVCEISSNSTQFVPAEIHSDVVLECDVEDSSFRNFVWVTPGGRVIVPGNDSDPDCPTRPALLEDYCSVENLDSFADAADNLYALRNGSLVVKSTGWPNRGFYQCLASDDEGRFTRSRHFIEIDEEYRYRLYNVSLIYGVATAGGFLLFTLLFKLAHFLLHNYGCCLFCCCCKNQLPPKARRLKAALESIEAYRSQQQERLRENYAQQSEWIRQNCAVQMERVRENYNWQVKNIKDIRHYGSSQVSAVRDQYYEQMSRIRDYSTSQLQRVHENYIFQRQRLRKFNAQNYLKIRETRQYTQRTLHKVIDNLPTLYMDLTACRQGLNERQPSIEWDPDTDPSQILEMEKFHQQRMQQLNNFSDRNSDSVYFTPTGTPMREVSSMKATPTRDPGEGYRAVYQQQHHSKKGHKRGRSLTHFLSGWLSGQDSSHDAASGAIHRVQVEHEQCNDDYFDSEVSEAGKESAVESDKLLLPRKSPGKGQPNLGDESEEASFIPNVQKIGLAQDDSRLGLKSVKKRLSI